MSQKCKNCNTPIEFFKFGGEEYWRHIESTAVPCPSSVAEPAVPYPSAEQLAEKVWGTKNSSLWKWHELSSYQRGSLIAEAGKWLSAMQFFAARMSGGKGQ